MNEKEEIRLTPISAPLVLDLVCKTLGVESVEVAGKSRRRELVEGRQIFCNLMKEFSELTLKSIGKTVCYDHAMVLYSIRNIDVLKQTDASIKRKYKAAKNVVMSNYAMMNIDYNSIAQL